MCVVLDMNQFFFSLSLEGAWQLLWSVKHLFWLSVFQSFSLIIFLSVYLSLNLFHYPLLFSPLEWQLAGSSRLLYTEIIGQKVLLCPVYLWRNECQYRKGLWTFVHMILEWKDDIPLIKTIEGRNRNGGVEHWMLARKTEHTEWEQVRANESPTTSPLRCVSHL